ncbi:hypothetical protein T439DRAFT_371383 [Meredithblackwellia eburnea MCA 4105]
MPRKLSSPSAPRPSELSREELQKRYSMVNQQNKDLRLENDGLINENKGLRDEVAWRDLRDDVLIGLNTATPVDKYKKTTPSLSEQIKKADGIARSLMPTARVDVSRALPSTPPRRALPAPAAPKPVQTLPQSRNYRAVPGNLALVTKPPTFANVVTVLPRLPMTPETRLSTPDGTDHLWPRSRKSLRVRLSTLLLQVKALPLQRPRGHLLPERIIRNPVHPPWSSSYSEYSHNLFTAEPDVNKERKDRFSSSDRDGDKPRRDGRKKRSKSEQKPKQPKNSTASASAPSPFRRFFNPFFEKKKASTPARPRRPELGSSSTFSPPASYQEAPQQCNNLEFLCLFLADDGHKTPPNLIKKEAKPPTKPAREAPIIVTLQDSSDSSDESSDPNPRERRSYRTRPRSIVSDEHYPPPPSLPPTPAPPSSLKVPTPYEAVNRKTGQLSSSSTSPKQGIPKRKPDTPPALSDMRPVYRSDRSSKSSKASGNAPSKSRRDIPSREEKELRLKDKVSRDSGRRSSSFRRKPSSKYKRGRIVSVIEPERQNDGSYEALPSSQAQVASHPKRLELYTSYVVDSDPEKKRVSFAENKGGARKAEESDDIEEDASSAFFQLYFSSCPFNLSNLLPFRLSTLAVLIKSHSFETPFNFQSLPAANSLATREDGGIRGLKLERNQVG